MLAGGVVLVARRPTGQPGAARPVASSVLAGVVLPLLPGLRRLAGAGAVRDACLVRRPSYAALLCNLLCNHRPAQLSAFSLVFSIAVFSLTSRKQGAAN